MVYLCSQSVKLTSCNHLSVWRDIEKTVGPVQKIERHGLSLNLTCSSMKQKEEVLACSLLGNIDAIASMLSYLLCKILTGFAQFRQVSTSFAMTIHRLWLVLNTAEFLSSGIW